MSQATIKGLLTRLSSTSRTIWENQFGTNEQTVQSLCNRLLTLRGETAAILVADEINERLAKQTNEENLIFFEFLLTDMQPDQAKLQDAAKTYLTNPTPDTICELAKASDARFMSLFRMMSTSPRGPHALVKLRQSLHKVLPEHPRLKPLDQGLVHIFRSWFNRGFLTLEKIDWTTPAHILEKLISYEAVHEIKGWPDLRRRLDDDRRCYAFFHPALKDEPLIFVQVALVDSISNNIQTLLNQSPESAAIEPNTAIFYSISNCQPGLKGISFGNFLIKQVVRNLNVELPELKQFSTLSPIPGFRKWFDVNHPSKTSMNENDKPRLMDACAHYLLNEKRKTFPLDPVARFHLGNGATLARLNWNGDSSDRGQKQSHGIMVNYVYDMSKVEKNHDSFANDGTISTTSTISKLAAAYGKRQSS